MLWETRRITGNPLNSDSCWSQALSESISDDYVCIILKVIHFLLMSDLPHQLFYVKFVEQNTKYFVCILRLLLLNNESFIIHVFISRLSIFSAVLFFIPFYSEPVNFFLVPLLLAVYKVSQSIKKVPINVTHIHVLGKIDRYSTSSHYDSIAVLHITWKR